jgi:hypothetical protein
LKGGSPNEETTLKQDTKNSPYIPNQKKEIDKSRASTYRPPPAQTPIVDLKLYNPSSFSGKKDKPMYSSPFPYHIPVGGPSYPMGQLLQPLMYPVINQYSISTADPNMDFTKVNTVFEDILPIKEFTDTSSTIGERKNMLRFVRAVLIKQGDGEKISLDGKDKASLLSYLRFMELNPYHKDPTYNNPLRTLPNNMLLYRTAYPMRYSPEGGMIICAPTSIGINVRIYRMNMAEANIKEISKMIAPNLTSDYTYAEFDLWREIFYYEHIRENIFKQKISPNFVTMYSYYIADNNTINFDKINRFKGNSLKTVVSSSTEPLYLTTDSKSRIYHNAAPRYAGIIPSSVRNQASTSMYSRTQSLDTKEIKLNPNADSRQVLIALTEAPTHTLYSWASKIYYKDINIKKMINTGCYSDRVWFCMMFQLLIALYVLQKEQIVINDMNMKDNVFIKDLRVEANSSGWWKYRVQGIEYYIPNYGYLLQVDTTFKDLQKSTTLDDEKKQWKIYGSIYKSDNLTKDQLNEMSYNNFCNIINPNSFGEHFKHLGGVPPSSDVMSLLDKINKEADSSDHKTPFSTYINKFMIMFLHNRIGTYLLEKETKNIEYYGSKAFKKGDMVVYDSNLGKKWVMFLEEKRNEQKIDGSDIGLITNKAIVLTKTNHEDEIVKSEEVSMDELIPYTKTEKIDFLIKPNEPKYSDEDLLETYNIN